MFSQVTQYLLEKAWYKLQWWTNVRFFFEFPR